MVPISPPGAQVYYADGDKEDEVLALERVRLLVRAGEELPLASAGSLGATLANLRRLHKSGEFARQAQRRRVLEERLAELTAFAQERYSPEQQELAERRRSLTTSGHSGAAAASLLFTPAANIGGAVGRALALAAQLPASAKVTSARPPGSKTGLSWNLKVRQLLLGRTGCETWAASACSLYCKRTFS